jgi:hypothetical protein
MINIEVTDSPDSNALSAYTYFQNQLYIGRNSGDLWIKDNEVLPNHVMLEVIGNDLLFHPQRGVEFYLINGKRASAIRKIKEKDTVTIGKTKIKIIGFSETIRESKKIILNNKLNLLVEKQSSRLPVIEALTNLMKS